MFNMYMNIVLLFLSLLVTAESAKILAIYPVPSISHQVVFQKLTLELVKQGHDVTVITTDPAFPNKDGPQNLKEIDVHNISYNVFVKTKQEVPKSDLLNKLDDHIFFIRMMNSLFDDQLQLPEIQEVLLNKTEKQFDLILLEELGRPYLAISHIYNVPVILFSSFGGVSTTLEVFGLQTHPILYPSSFDLRIYNLSLWEKLEKYYKYYSFLHADSIVIEEENQLLKKHFGQEMPSINKLFKNVHMLFLNTYSIWVDNLPVPPSVIFLGGLHQLPTKELPQDLKNYLDSSKDGVIYVSFGTSALSDLLQTEKIQIITKVLSQLPYDVLWKWDQDSLPGQGKNIRLSKWLPQADLLKHPKIKLFITQAGLQSTNEAITAGVPLIGFPVLGDQWFNAEKYVHFGIGRKILFEEITEDVVKNAVESVISDISYRKNLIKFRELLNDEPMNPVDRATFWINHVLRNKGGKHLLPLGSHLTWAQYYQVETILFVFGVFSVLLILFIFVAYSFYRVIRNNLGNNQKIKTS